VYARPVNALPHGVRAWSWLGLSVAGLGLHLGVGPADALLGPLDSARIALRESVCFALAAVLLLYILPREGLSGASVGLVRPGARELATWVPLATLATFAAAVAGLLLGPLAGLDFGSAEASTYDDLPTPVFVLVILRAGLVEELFYRGYAIDRVQRLTGSRLAAIATPLVLFAVFHYKQGAGGALIALLTGGVLTGIYLYRRNLWINMAAHFLIDFVPNVLLPLFLTPE